MDPFEAGLNALSREHNKPDTHGALDPESMHSAMIKEDDDSQAPSGGLRAPLHHDSPASSRSSKGRPGSSASKRSRASSRSSRRSSRSSRRSSRSSQSSRSSRSGLGVERRKSAFKDFKKQRTGQDGGGGMLDDFIGGICPSPAGSDTNSGVGGKYNRPVHADLNDEEIQTMKLDILFKIKILNDAGYSSPRAYSGTDSLVTLEMELSRLQTLEDMSYGLQMCQWGLTNGVSVLESVNENFKMTPLKLKGWSTSVHRQAHKFDPILLELYQTYAYRVRLGPFTKLSMALSFSAVNTHMANTLRLGDEGMAGTPSQSSGIFASMLGAMGNAFGSKGGGAAAADGQPPVVTAPGRSNIPETPQPQMRGPADIGFGD